MKLLFDQNLSFKLCGQLTDLFPNSGHARPLGLAEADDLVLWQFAGANGLHACDTRCRCCRARGIAWSAAEGDLATCGNQATATVARLLREHGETIAAFERDPAACLEIHPLFT